MARIVDVKGRKVWDSRGRPTVEAEVAHLLAADRRTPRDHVPPHEHDDRPGDPHPSRLERDRDLPRVTPDERGRPGRGRLVGDVTAGVRCADHQDGAVAELAGATVFAGVQLQDRRVELLREVGNVR